jgi:peptidoglycan hydrolase-like protein with peptidoglycan-binding domain
VAADGICGPETDDALKGKGKSILVELQTGLQTYGYYDGDIDGDYGSATQDAVKQLQTDLGVTRAEGSARRPPTRSRRPSRTARSRRSSGKGLGRIRDLADDFDDVAVRVVDP